ncbi:MAG: hypothetical protein B6D36_17890 [Planctomycetes bacterium UTPLA1]|jgi:hypothetical protein|nr:MAG: hypothetical protein B6D36_17890 [Planctomycetes bacterium UTPLA1]
MFNKTRIPFDAEVVISPSMLSGETKDQDRALWFPQLGTACLADGVTSSPYGGDAAEHAVQLGPLVFLRGADEGLGTICNVLTIQRLKAQARKMKAPAGTSKAMLPMLREAAQERLANAFQTTFIGACLTPVDGQVLVRTVVCGDSAVFAFSNSGELLHSSLENPANPASGPEDLRYGGSTIPAIRHCPGDQLLVKIVKCLGECPNAYQSADIPPRYWENWFVCQVLDEIAPGVASDISSLQAIPRRNEIILVPRYLLGTRFLPENTEYRQLVYSNSIRQINHPRRSALIVSGSSVTAVLPDHVRSGHWIQDTGRFPTDVNIILASDGFHGCFSNGSALWQWLIENAQAEHDQDARDAALDELHKRLHAKQGDDDISFVWIRPSNPAESFRGGQ